MLSYKSIDGWFDFEQLYLDVFNYHCHYKNKDNLHFVEVGAWLGKSTCFLANLIKQSGNGKNIKFDVVDWWQGSLTDYEHNNFADDVNKIPDYPYRKFLNNMRKAGVINYINPIKMRSEDAVKNYLNESLDFVFIDASHVYDEIKHDLEIWYPKVKNDGIFAGHDYTHNHPDVVRAVNEFFHNINKKFISHGNDGDLGGSWLHVKSEDFNYAFNTMQTIEQSMENMETWKKKLEEWEKMKGN